MQIDTPGLTLLPRYDLSPQYVQTFLRFQSYLYRNISWYHRENLGENLGPSYGSQEIFQKDLDRNFPWIENC